MCRRSGSGARRFRCWWRRSWRGLTRSTGGTRSWRPRRWRASWSTRGRATSGSWRTRSAAWWSSPRVSRRLRPRSRVLGTGRPPRPRPPRRPSRRACGRSRAGPPAPGYSRRTPAPRRRPGGRAQAPGRGGGGAVDIILQLVLNGLAVGCIYGLVALGFVLIYKATELVNFAQGDLMMLGAFTCYMFIVWHGFGYWTAVALAVAS